jgi:hypothetical protein
MANTKKPDVYTLYREYRDAVNRSMAFYGNAEKPLSKEDQAEHDWLKKLSLDALSKFYEAGGTLNPNVNDWVVDGQIAAEAYEEIAALQPDDPNAQAAAKWQRQQAEYRQAAVNLEQPET